MSGNARQQYKQHHLKMFRKVAYTLRHFLAPSGSFECSFGTPKKQYKAGDKFSVDALQNHGCNAWAEQYGFVCAPKHGAVMDPFGKWWTCDDKKQVIPWSGQAPQQPPALPATLAAPAPTPQPAQFFGGATSPENGDGEFDALLAAMDNADTDWDLVLGG